MGQSYEELSRERKELQKKGWLPEWYSTGSYQMFKSKYAVEGEESVKGRFFTIAKTLAAYLPEGMQKEWEQKFFDVMWKGWLSPASPILANTGTNRGLNVSCSGGVVGDSVHSFYDALHEQAILSKNGFGCSADFSQIRPRGAPISGGGKASGVVPVIEDFAIMASKISQGSTRRGSTASYLPIDHGDFEELADLLMHSPDGLNIGWIVTDAFIDRLKANDPDAQARFQRVIYVKLVTGKGYFFFIDKVNRARPEMYKERGLEVKASNLCVAPETKILTKNGNVEIRSVAGTTQEVWNGEEWSSVDVVKTGVDQKLIKITLSSGHMIECTPYHKFVVYRSRGKIPASDVVVGDLVPVVSSDKNISWESVVSVVDELRIDDTYCFNEPKQHMGVFNGILTGNCNEIRLYADDGEQGSFDSDEGGHSFTCVLSSMNIFKYDEWKDTDAVFVSTVFLDCVVSDFLAKSYGVHGLQRVHRFTRKGRPIGLGILGFASYLQKHMIPYESMDAYYLNHEIAEKLHLETLEASRWLASILGEPEWCKGHGVRNTHRTALAPTKSTSNIQSGVSESFSPEPAMVWTQGSAAGEVARISPVFLELLKSKGMYNDEVINSIISRIGSVQHLEQLTDEEKEVFKTAFEIDQFALIRMAAARQKFIDQGQSLNLFVSADGDEQRIAALHSEAFVNEDIHGLYYIYSQSGVVVSSACVACEA